MASRKQRGTGLIAGALVVAPLWLFASCADGQELVIEDMQAGLAAWRSVESVLTHPRCLNCHTMTDYPRQDDERRPHGLMVKRGPDGHGEGPKCQACHTEDNKADSGIPGAKDWHMAPLALAWESEPGKPATGAAICATLKRDGGGQSGPDYERLIEYAQLAAFVQWAWEPGQQKDGTERSTPLLTHDEFVEALKRWISAGAPCPVDGALPPASPEAAPKDTAPADASPPVAAPADGASEAQPMPPEPVLPETAAMPQPAWPEAAPKDGLPTASIAPEPPQPASSESAPSSELDPVARDAPTAEAPLTETR